jgi:SAM-dependent methyltransferase
MGRLGRFLSRRTPPDSGTGRTAPAQNSASPAPAHRRFLSERGANASEYLQAAQVYMRQMSGFELDWLYRKPFDPRPGNEQFFLQMYAVMNLLRAMEVPAGGRILEIGSGPGWVTELLMLLGYGVDGIEPCEDLVKVARERIEGASRLYRLRERPRVEFHLTTLEEAELPDETFDAVFFHDALHHVLDEDRAIAHCFRVLKRGGMLGVSEDAWRPGNRMQESALEEEISRFATHESPFTQEYLDHLLTRNGFLDIQRYYSVNGFFPAEMGSATLDSIAQSSASLSNNLTAWKPSFEGSTTMDAGATTSARIEIVARSYQETDRKMRLTIRLVNTGETVWLCRPRKAGWVSIALRTDPLGAPDSEEAQPRHRLPRNVAPGEELELQLDFFHGEGQSRRSWRLDLVNEGLFWFSQRGTIPAIIGSESGIRQD